MERTLDQLPSWAVELVDAAPVAHLGVLDSDGRPRVLPITYATVDGVIWSAVDHKPKRVPGEQIARVRWLRAEPRAALTVDSYDADWSRLAWVQVLCSASVLDAEGHDHVLDALARRYPSYRERAPRGPLIALRPERVICWRAGEA